MILNEKNKLLNNSEKENNSKKEKEKKGIKTVKHT